MHLLVNNNKILNNPTQETNRQPNENKFISALEEANKTAELHLTLLSTEQHQCCVNVSDTGDQLHASTVASQH